MRPDDLNGAEHLARVIDEVFKCPTREEPGEGWTTASEASAAAIGAQLAVLDDANSTGTGRAAADELFIETIEVTGLLHGNLVRQIVHAGSRGGLLEPLADARAP